MTMRIDRVHGEFDRRIVRDNLNEAPVFEFVSNDEVRRDADAVALQRRLRNASPLLVSIRPETFTEAGWPLRLTKRHSSSYG